jgi:magnesium transporter
MMIRSYRGGSVVHEDPDLVWVDLCDPSEDELSAVGSEYGLHALAVEDAVQRNQRPKLDHYDGHLFITMYQVHLDGEHLRSAEFAVFATDHVVVTVRWPDGPPIDPDRFELPPKNVGCLLHSLLDLVVDSQLDTVQALDERLDELEEQLFSDRPSKDVARSAAKLRRSMSRLRRLSLPMREIVSGLLRHEPFVADGHLKPYFRDVLDHAAHTEDWLESLRELAATFRETELGIQGNKLNDVMKKVTGWAAVIAVPTAITGFYGQNVPYPGSEQPWGFWVSTAVICLMSVGLYISFRRRDWL